MAKVVKKIVTSILCTLRLHWRRYNNTVGFQSLGECMWCHQTVCQARSDVLKGETVYELPKDCGKLVRAIFDNYASTYSITRQDDNLLVVPAPNRDHVRGLRITYIKK